MNRHLPFDPALTRRTALLAGSAAGIFAGSGAAFGQISFEDGQPGTLPGFAEDVLARMARWEAHGWKRGRVGDMRSRITLVYRTDPEKTRALLPPPFEVDPEALVYFNSLNILVPPGYDTVLAPGPDYGEVDLSVTCYYKGLRYQTSLPWILTRDFGRYAGREGAMLRKKDGFIHHDFEDGVATSYTVRQGRKMLVFEGRWLDEPAHPRAWYRERGNGELRVDMRLHADWTKGPFSDLPVELWRHFGSPEGEPTQMPPDTGDHARFPRRLDLKNTRFSLGDASPLDPYIDLPVLEMIDGSIGDSSQVGVAGYAVPRERGTGQERRGAGGGMREKIAELDPAEMAPFAFWCRAYDPPIFDNKVKVPAGWPDRGSAVAASPEALEGWKTRAAMRLSDADLLLVDFALDPTVYGRSLPPGTNPARPVLRMIGANVRVSDFATVPFTEIWLLTPCELDGSEVWYALSHIVSPDGDVLLGRETWGYPTKQAEILTIEPGADAISLRLRRLHREVAAGRISRTAASPASLDESFTVLGIQSLGVSDAGTRNARYVTQPWTVRIRTAERLPPAAIELGFPREASPSRIGRKDPWFEFDGASVTQSLFGSGEIARRPGAYASGPLGAEIRAASAERNDAPGGDDPHPSTFLIRSD
ncbi:MAG: acetoacetate decarboxylase family protein [Alphaproteobacteria bacterium]|nr:acetoacetate decarboxylase family protein [Alphaproteobacteria bacterium]